MCICGISYVTIMCVRWHATLSVISFAWIFLYFRLVIYHIIIIICYIYTVYIHIEISVLRDRRLGRVNECPRVFLRTKRIAECPIGLANILGIRWMAKRPENWAFRRDPRASVGCRCCTIWTVASRRRIEEAQSRQVGESWTVGTRGFRMWSRVERKSMRKSRIFLASFSSSAFIEMMRTLKSLGLSSRIYEENVESYRDVYIIYEYVDVVCGYAPNKPKVINREINR